MENNPTANQNYQSTSQLPWLNQAWQQWLQLSQRLGHAYLISGPQGIGLADFAKQIAHSVICQIPNQELNNGLACGQCHSCHLFSSQQHPDFFTLARLEEKKEITVDQVRELIYKLNETSHQGGYKVVWIDGVEYLNQSAFNAILKNLEEPAAQTLFLLTTHQIDRLPATIISRCQLLSITPPPLSAAVEWLHQQSPQADEALIKRALRLNWGAPLDALNWTNEGLFEEDQQWKNDLKQLQAGRKSVTQAVASWLKWQEPERVFDYFYQWSVSAVRSTMYQDSNAEINSEKNHQVQNWLRFQQAVLNAKQFWQRNANKELLLENLCIEWLQIQQPTISPETGTFEPLNSVFSNQLQRGTLA